MNRVNLELVYENKLLKVYEYKKKTRGTMNRHKTIVFEYFSTLYCSVFDGNKGRIVERQVKDIISEFNQTHDITILGVKVSE